MEVAQGTEQTQSSTVSETQVQDASVQETSTTEAGAQSTETPAAPVFTPNYKFKVMDREHEIPEMFRSVIKDAQSEKQARDIFERAHGLDFVKSDRDNVKQDYKRYKETAEPVVRAVDTATQAFHRKDYETMFRTLGIPDRVIQEYVFKKLQYEDLQPQQKAEYDRQREIERQNWQLQQELEQTRSASQQESARAIETQLNFVLTKPDVAQFQQAFDQRNGQGSFRDECILRGRVMSQTLRRQATPEEVIQDLVQKYGFQAQPATPAPTQAQPASNQELPVIPAVKGGGSTSPASKAITSLADLEKIRREKLGY